MADEKDDTEEGTEWENQYVGEKKKNAKKILTPQVLALRQRAKAGLRPSTSKDTAHRVETIAEEMRQDRWSRERYDYYQKLWQLSRSRISQIAAEASRMSAKEVVDPGVVTQTVASILHRKILEADELSSMANMRVEKDIAKNPQLGASVQIMADSAKMFGAINMMADTWTKVVGARAPEVHEHNHHAENYNALSPQQKLYWLDDKISKLQSARTKLLQEISIETVTEPTQPAGTIEAMTNGRHQDVEGSNHRERPSAEHDAGGNASRNGFRRHDDKE